MACGYECVSEFVMAAGLPCMDVPLDTTCDEDLPSFNCCGEGATCCDGECHVSPSASLLIDRPHLVCGDPTCCDLEGPGPGIVSAEGPSGAAAEPFSDMEPAEGPALAPALAPGSEELERGLDLTAPLGVYGDDDLLQGPYGDAVFEIGTFRL